MTTMTEKFKILGQFIKDMSSETKDIETYIFVKDKISKYELDININSKPLKNKMVEINTTLRFEDKEEAKHKLDEHEKKIVSSKSEIQKAITRKKKKTTRKSKNSGRSQCPVS